jgi:hypothetical protein
MLSHGWKLRTLGGQPSAASTGSALRKDEKAKESREKKVVVDVGM